MLDRISKVRKRCGAGESHHPENAEILIERWRDAGKSPSTSLPQCTRPPLQRAEAATCTEGNGPIDWVLTSSGHDKNFLVSPELPKCLLYLTRKPCFCPTLTEMLTSASEAGLLKDEGLSHLEALRKLQIRSCSFLFLFYGFDSTVSLVSSLFPSYLITKLDPLVTQQRSDSLVICEIQSPENGLHCWKGRRSDPRNKTHPERGKRDRP